MPVWARSALFTLVPGALTVLVPWLVLDFGYGVLAVELGPARHAGWALIAVGALGYVACAASFGREGRGTPAPWDAPRELVGGGCYRFSRNPMYVSLVALLVGEALVNESGIVALYAAVIALVFHMRVVQWEEPVLRELFGARFEAYCARVPRWFGRRREN